MPDFVEHNLATAQMEVFHDFLLMLVILVFGDLISQGLALVEEGLAEYSVMVRPKEAITVPRIGLYAPSTLIAIIVAVPVYVLS